MKEYVVPICLTVFNVLFLGLISWIVKVKAKSDKADVEKIVDKKIKHEMKTYEDDIREIKQTTHFLQTAVSKIETSQEVDKEKFNNLIELIKTSRQENRENFILIFDKLDKTKDN